MLEYGFFDSINGDRRYNSKNFSDHFEGLISGGVYGYVGEKLKVSPGDGMNVIVGTGRAMILNRYVKNTSLLSIDVSSADSQYPRSDAVVVGIDLNERIGEIKVIPGVPGEAAERPEIPSGENMQYYVLAYIRIDANTTSVPVENIYDMRGTSECPWVVGLIDQIDGSGMADQYRAMIDKFEDESKAAVDNAIGSFETDSQEVIGEFERKGQEAINALVHDPAISANIQEVIDARTSSISGEEFSTLSERLESDFANLKNVMQAVEVMSSYIVVNIERGDNTEIKYYADDTLRITGVGSVNERVFEHREDFGAAEINIGGDVGVEAFGGCTNLNMVTVDCKKICDRAFWGCPKLHSLTIGKSVSEIGSGIISNSAFYIPNGVRIKYNGTVSEWNAITKDENWVGEMVTVENGVIICSDGTVEV